MFLVGFPSYLPWRSLNPDSTLVGLSDTSNHWMLSTRFCPRGFCTIYELPEVQLRFSTCSIVLSPENPTNNECIRRYKYSLGIAISTNFWWVPTSEETYLHDVVLIRCEVWSNVHRWHAWKAGSRQKMPGNLQRCHWLSVARTSCLRGYQIHHRCYGARATTWPALSSVLKTPRSGGKCLKKGKWRKQTLRFNVGFVWNQRFDACLAKGHLLVMSTRTNFPLSSTLHFCTLKKKNGCHARLDGMHPCTHAALWLELGWLHSRPTTMGANCSCFGRGKEVCIADVSLVGMAASFQITCDRGFRSGKSSCLQQHWNHFEACKQFPFTSPNLIPFLLRLYVGLWKKPFLVRPSFVECHEFLVFDPSNW